MITKDDWTIQFMLMQTCGNHLFSVKNQNSDSFFVFIKVLQISLQRVRKGQAYTVNERTLYWYLAAWATYEIYAIAMPI